jgi:hypothetical protein
MPWRPGRQWTRCITSQNCQKSAEAGAAQRRAKRRTEHSIVVTTFSTLSNYFCRARRAIYMPALSARRRQLCRRGGTNYVIPARGTVGRPRGQRRDRPPPRNPVLRVRRKRPPMGGGAARRTGWGLGGIWGSPRPSYSSAKSTRAPSKRMETPHQI